MAMKNPVHPGVIVREDWGKPGTSLGMWLAYDLARSRDLERKIKVKRIAAA